MYFGNAGENMANPKLKNKQSLLWSRKQPYKQKPLKSQSHSLKELVDELPGKM